jgi:hypothetical protein
MLSVVNQNQFNMFFPFYRKKKSVKRILSVEQNNYWKTENLVLEFFLQSTLTNIYFTYCRLINNTSWRDSPAAFSSFWVRVFLSVIMFLIFLFYCLCVFLFSALHTYIHNTYYIVLTLSPPPPSPSDFFPFYSSCLSVK